jgi:ribosome-associated protein
MNQIFINDELTIPETELSWHFSPSSGPGGQHANRTHSRVELRWNAVASAVVSDWQRQLIASRLGPIVMVRVDDERSQHRNREIARERLATIVRRSLQVPKARRKTKPSRGAKERRHQDKQQRSSVKRQRQRPQLDD